MNDTKQSYPLKLLLWKRTKASPIFNQCSTSIPLEIIRKTPVLEGEHWLKMGLKKKSMRKIGQPIQGLIQAVFDIVIPILRALISDIVIPILRTLIWACPNLILLSKIKTTNTRYSSFRSYE